MRVIRLLDEMQQVAGSLRMEGKTIGLVPTMGCLHEGHLSLVDLARERCDAVVVTVFVNPTQFGEGEDFEQYPQDLDRDLALCEDRQVDLVFAPTRSEVFPEGHSTYVEETKMAQGLCGEARPTHFRGVVTVCLKLFVLCQPNVAFFGQKDAQQVAVIRRMVRDFHLPVEIAVGPTVREDDGLAMSSRNLYLDPDQRREALLIIEALQAGKAIVEGGGLQANQVKMVIEEVLARGSSLSIIYAEVVDSLTMEPIDREIEPGRDLLVVAVWVDSIRLIDNLQL